MTTGADGSVITTPPALLTFGGQTYTADSSSDFLVAGQTLTPGGKITVSGTVISEAPVGSGIVVVGSSTQVLSHSPVPGAPSSAAIMTFNGKTYTADAASDFVVEGQTLTPGGMITVSGTPISEAPGGTGVVIGSSTERLATATISPSVMVFEGAAPSIRGSRPSWSIWTSWWTVLCFSSGILFLRW